MTKLPPKRIYTVPQATRLINEHTDLDVSEATVRTWCRRDVIHASRVGEHGRWRILRRDLQAFIEANSESVDKPDQRV